MKIRVGFGFDVHQLVAGRELWLGGIRLPNQSSRPATNWCTSKPKAYTYFHIVLLLFYWMNARKYGKKSKWGIKTERKLHKLRNFSSYIRQPIGA